jgi:starch synthase (maltosyl-transferring)
MNMAETNGRIRVVIEGIEPEIDAGAWPVKRTIGDSVAVRADIFADGHDAISSALLYRHESESTWNRVAMLPLVNDRWEATFRVWQLGLYRYTIQAWLDPFESWRLGMAKKALANQDVAVELLVGAGLMEEAATRASGADAQDLMKHATFLRSSVSQGQKVAITEDEALKGLMAKYPDLQNAVTYPVELSVVVDRRRARFSAWYEMFPRSCGSGWQTHGTLRDCEARLPYVASMGFDVLYLPPVHPIGRNFRKGKNNSTTADSEDPGSPWAIGAREGGHTALHPELGTVEDFRRLVARAEDHGMEIALDLAFQCSPDHPWVGEHPEWFRLRPDGTIQYAENPPKKYEDIYPLNFECEHWEELWRALKEVVDFWIEQGVRIFRVDNPHTKPFPFWHWLIGEVKRETPEVLFLAEAFTRPKVMYQLAKLGFTQSYTYFAWRNTQWELRRYFEELYQTEVVEFFRANLWPNTPDILTEYLQLGGRPAFIARLVLAATLGANYGIYGPAYELCANQAREFGSEEYLDSEKYEIKDWDIDSPDSLRHLIGTVNRIRRENPALQNDRSLCFHPTDNEQLICYSKHSEDGSNVVLCVVNLDPHHTQSGWITLNTKELWVDPHAPFQAHDLLGAGRYLWTGPRNYVELNPHLLGAQIFRLRFKIRTERDFDYYM